MTFRNPNSFKKEKITAISALAKGDTMGERMRRIGQIQTDFFF
jgi:hypothetical protein